MIALVSCFYFSVNIHMCQQMAANVWFSLPPVLVLQGAERAKSAGHNKEHVSPAGMGQPIDVIITQNRLDAASGESPQVGPSVARLMISRDAFLFPFPRRANAGVQPFYEYKG